MRNIFMLLCLMLFISCGQTGQTVSLVSYFGLDSLLDAQQRILINNQAGLEKTVTLDGIDEKRTYTPNLEDWVRELDMIRDFDINQNSMVGAYDITAENEQIRYTLKPGNRAPVKELVINTKDSNLQIVGTYLEDKSIYQNQRKLTLLVEDDKLLSFGISGYQKIVMKDTIFYNISGVVQ